MTGDKGADSTPGRSPWPQCQACAAEGRCRFQDIVQVMIGKAEVLLGLGRDSDAEELIAMAYRLCDETHGSADPPPSGG